MTTISKAFTFPKVAYTSTCCVNIPVIEVELRDADSDYPELSICGEIRNENNTGIVMAGQCLDKMAKLGDLEINPLFRKLHRLWKLYHLNSMRDGGPLQTEALKECNHSSYKDKCAYLESKGLLYEDGIKYGTQEWYHKIPEDDLKTIIELLTEDSTK